MLGMLLAAGIMVPDPQSAGFDSVGLIREWLLDAAVKSTHPTRFDRIFAIGTWKIR